MLCCGALSALRRCRSDCRREASAESTQSPAGRTSPEGGSSRGTLSGGRGFSAIGIGCAAAWTGGFAVSPQPARNSPAGVQQASRIAVRRKRGMGHIRAAGESIAAGGRTSIREVRAQPSRWSNRLRRRLRRNQSAAADANAGRSGRSSRTVETMRTGGNRHTRHDRHIQQAGPTAPTRAGSRGR